MPNSPKVILDRMVYKGAMTEAERDKIMRSMIKVRCKDCKHNPDCSDDDICPFVDSDSHVREFPSEHDFCSRGERREDNG